MNARNILPVPAQPMRPPSLFDSGVGNVLRRISRLAAITAVGLCLAHPAIASTQLKRTSAFEYDFASGLLVKEVIEPGDSNLCLVTEYGYDVYGNKQSATTRNCNVLLDSAEAGSPTGDAVIDPRTTRNEYAAGATTGATWAAGQYPTLSTNALGQTESKTYDPRFGTVASLTGPNGLTTTWTYDGLGRKTLEVRADLTRTQWDYRYCAGVNNGTENCPTIGGAAGAYVVVTTPQTSGGAQNGPIGKTYYDALDRPIRSETQGYDGTGTGRAIYQDTQYDNRGRPSQKSRPYYAGDPAYWITTTYDDLNRVIKVNDADGDTTTKYDGLKVTVTNAKLQKRTTTRNSQGQIVSVEDDYGKALTYEYDPFGNLTKTIDPLGNVTQLGYDLRGRKTVMLDPDMGNWRYAYDALGQLIRQTDAKSQVALMTYDKLGRMTERAEADLISRWYYDTGKNGAACPKGIGKLCQAETTTGYNKRMTYDGKGRYAGATTTIDTDYATGVTYDDASGRLATQTYPGGIVVDYAYTGFGYLKEIRYHGSSGYYWRADSMDAEGHVLLQSYGNGVQTQQNYNPATGRIGTIVAGNGSVQNLSYDYDHLGNMLSRTDSNQNLIESFTYDRLNRLETAQVNASAVSPAATTTFGYDELGNIKSRTDLGSYDYPLSGANAIGPHAVKRINLNGGGYRTYTWDANGNLTGEAQYGSRPVALRGRTEVHTSFNMPQAFGSFVLFGSSASAAYQYGPEHQRVQEISSSQGTTIYVNPGNSGDLLYEKQIKTDGTVEHRSYLTAYGTVIGAIKQVPPVYFVPIQEAPTQYRYFHRDNLGSIVAVTDVLGTVIERLAYEPFGKRRFPSGVQDTSNTLVGVTTERGFTNHEHIDELGLIHMNGRIYDPMIGRFMSADPQIQAPGNLQSYNRYSYGFNNPLGGMDPSGYGFFSDLFHPFVSAWKSVWGSTVGRVAVTVAVAYFTGQWIGDSFIASAGSAESGLTAMAYNTGCGTAGLTTSGYAVVGAGTGFVVGAAGGGDLQSGLRGAASGALLGGVDGYYGDSWSMERVAAKSFAGGIAARIQGGRFEDGFLRSGLSSGSGYLYNNIVGYDATATPGENRPGDQPDRQIYSTDESDRIRPQDRGMNIVGLNEPFDGSSWDAVRQGGMMSRALNAVPGINAIAGLDDYLNNASPSSLGDALWFKAVTIPTAVIGTVPALFDRVPVYRPLDPFGRRR